MGKYSCCYGKLQLTIVVFTFSTGSKDRCKFQSLENGTSDCYSQLVAQFVRPDPDDPSLLRWYTAALKVPTGKRRTSNARRPLMDIDATCLETISVSGRTALLVGGPQGVRYWSSRDSTTKNAPGTDVTTSPIFKGISSMTVSQNGNRVCIWAVNGKSELGYLNCTTDNVAGTPIKLTQQTSSFSTVTALTDADGSPGVRHILVSNDDTGNLTTLEMNHKTGIWRKEPFYVVAASKNIKIKCYTITIQAIDSQGAAIVNGSILIQSSSSVPAVVNGKGAMLSDTGSWHRLDGHGEIAVIVATSGISGQVLTAMALKDVKSTPITFSATIVDPTKKSFAAFKIIRTTDDLKRATTKTGKSLIGLVPQPDLENAVKCIVAANDAAASLPKDGSVQQNSAGPTAGAPDAGDPFMEAFNWVKEQARDAYDWFIEKIGECCRLSIGLLLTRQALFGNLSAQWLARSRNSFSIVSKRLAKR